MGGHETSAIVSTIEDPDGHSLDISGHRSNPVFMASEREKSTEILFSGNLVTPRRTVMGVFGHFAESDIPIEEVGALLLECGLPPIALEEHDIPITHDQQLAVISRVLERTDPERSIASYALDVGYSVHITGFSVLGLAAMHAANLAECLRVFTTYPELSWSHSHLTVGRRGEELFQSFMPDAKLRRGALRDYCVTVDLIATIRIVVDIFGPQHEPTQVWLPYPAPDDRRRLTRRLGCPVRFDAPDARLFYPASLWRATPRLENPILFRAYEKLCVQLARALRTDVALGEQVRRLLWVSSPPPDRDTVASMLALSPRTLARKLAAEGTSYGELQREVRFARARELLENRTLQIAEIADRLGFSDPAAFSRAFRTWTAETPSAWRERLIDVTPTRRAGP